MREKINIQMSPYERVEYEKQVSGLRGSMDEKAFSTLWAEGRVMTMEQAVVFALEREEGLSANPR